MQRDGAVLAMVLRIFLRVIAQTTLRRRILRAFVGRSLFESFEAREMLAYKHSGFSVDAGVCIESHDRVGLERLLRYCARPPFAMERLRKAGGELVYRCSKQRSEPGSYHHADRRGNKADELHLTPLELIDRMASLVPPPRTHRHRQLSRPDRFGGPRSVQYWASCG